jgi:membrane protease YdiL (CAAX protease family)
MPMRSAWRLKESDSDTSRRPLSWRFTVVLLVLFASLPAAKPFLARDDHRPSDADVPVRLEGLIPGACESSVLLPRVWCERSYRLIWGLPLGVETIHSETAPSFESLHLMRLTTGAMALVLVTGLAACVPLLAYLRSRHRTAELLRPSDFNVRLGIFLRVQLAYGISFLVAAGLWILLIGSFGIDPVSTFPWAEVAAGLVALATLRLLCERHLEHQSILKVAKRIPDLAAALPLLGLCLVGDMVLAQILGNPGLHEVEAIRSLGLSSWVARAVSTVAIAPLLEEPSFRWLLYSSMRARFTSATAIVVSSITFALGHAHSGYSIASAGWFGLVMATYFARTGRIGSLVVSHSCFNAYWMLALSALGG